MTLPGELALAFSARAGALIIIGVMTGLFLIILGWSLYQAGGRRPSRSRPEDAAIGGPPAGTSPAGSTRPRSAVSRRDLLRGGLIASLAVFLAEFGGASLAFLWPNLKGQFGSVITAGKLADIKSYIQQNDQPFYYGAGRFYVVPYEGDGATTLYDGLVQDELMALYQRCVHLGCRVPFCQASQWFECPCHGSKYNEAGEYQLGPAPRGLDRFKLSVDSGGVVSVDTATIVTGPPRGTNTTHQAAEGAFCVGGAAGG